MGTVAPIHTVVGVPHRPEQQLNFIVEASLYHLRVEGQIDVVLVFAIVVPYDDQLAGESRLRVDIVLDATI